MPIYEYVCTDCCYEFELMRPMSESERPTPCPQCGKSARKQVSSFGSKTGFYVKVPEKGPFRKLQPKPAKARATAKTTGKSSARARGAEKGQSKGKPQTVAKKKARK